jgi:uncharacterized tellurite resistance protein B-like protein
MVQEEKSLKDYSDQEKGAYISAIASLATADRSAGEEELTFLDKLADAADLSPQQKINVHNAATDATGKNLKDNLDLLKGSELRFSLLTDLIAFAEADQNYSAEEKANIEKIAQYLEINGEQFATINQFVQKASTADVSEEQVKQQGFLGSLGMENKFKSAGINMGSISKGLLGMLAPMILGGMVSRGLGGRSGGGLGGMLGGMLGGGGIGGMLGGAGRGGGLGSLIGMLSGGRGIGSTGGLLGRMLGR